MNTSTASDNPTNSNDINLRSKFPAIYASTPFAISLGKKRFKTLLAIAKNTRAETGTLYFLRIFFIVVFGIFNLLF
jgi:hypothetical protein